MLARYSRHARLRRILPAAVAALLLLIVLASFLLVPPAEGAGVTEERAPVAESAAPSIAEHTCPEA